MNKNLLDFVACPHCNTSLSKEDNSLFCKKCKEKYPVENEIPVLIYGRSTQDVEISQDKWDVQYSNLDNVEKFINDPMIVSQKNFLNNYKNQIKKGILLDLGCGVAWQSYFLAKDAKQVIGIDISGEAVKISHALFKKNNLDAIFIQGDFLHIPLKDKSVDTIYWGLALEYVKDVEKAIGEAYRVLKPGGTLIAPFPPISFTTFFYHQLRGGDIPRMPIIGSLMELIHMKILRGKYMHFGYGQTFTTGYIRNLFQKTGFTVKKVGYFNTYYPLSLVPAFLRSSLRGILRFRPLWPFAYIEATR